MAVIKPGIGARSWNSINLYRNISNRELDQNATF